MKKKVLLTGAKGMLASDFQKYQGKYFEVIACSKAELDISNIKEVESILSEVQPHIVLNCAAYTAVDNAEDIGKKENFDTNTLGVFYLAQICSQYQIDFVTLSTDYVFDGEKRKGYSETDTPNPLSNYGIAKYLGEQLAQSIYPNTIIVRTSWLYGGGKKYKNFVNTILQLAATGNEIKVVDDEYGVLNSTYDVCLALGKLMGSIKEYRGKVLHFSSSLRDGVLSRFELAKYIGKYLKEVPKVSPCSSQEYGAKTKRPKYSLLKNNSSIELPDWKIGIQRYIQDII